MRKRIVQMSAGILLLSLCAVPAAWAKDKLVMGVHPYKPVTELYQKFKPIADHVSRALGKPVELHIGKTYADTVERVGKGDMDFAFLGPSLYVACKNTYDAAPLAQIINAGKPSMHGVIVAKKGSGIASLKDLKGKSFAFGDRESTLTHIVPLSMLLEAGIRLSNLKQHAFLGSHDNVAMNVLRGTFQAAGLQPDVAEKYKDQGLEIIARSPEIPEHVFTASKTMDAATAAGVQTALLSMDGSLLKGIKDSLTGIRKCTDKDFDGLRKIMKSVEKETKS